MALLEPAKKGRLARHWPLWTWAVIIVFVVVLVFGIVSFALFALTGGAVAVYGGHKFSERPAFCAAMCHVMEESVESWEESTHEGVICAECHSRPGPKGLWEGAVVAPIKESWLVITGNYGHKPLAVDVADESCMREHCHKRKLLDGEVRFRSVTFDHGEHLDSILGGRRLKCVSCHSQTSKGTHMAVNEQVCFTCHFKESKKEDLPHDCSTCHDVPQDLVTYKGMEFDHRESDGKGVPCVACHAGISHGKGESDPDRCIACHEEGHAEGGVTDAAPMHESHVVEYNARCLDCHDEINHRIPEDFEVACGLCHDQEDRMYRGLDRAGKPVAPSKKAGPLEMDCTVCHTEDAGYTATEEACQPCHEGKKGRTIDDVQLSFDRELTAAKEAIASLKGALGGKNKPSLSSMLSADAARTDLELLLNDGSRGVHNPSYARGIASHVGELVRAARRGIGTPPTPAAPVKKEPPKEEKKIPHGDLGECSNCH